MRQQASRKCGHRSAGCDCEQKGRSHAHWPHQSRQHMLPQLNHSIALFLQNVKKQINLVKIASKVIY